MHILSLKNIQIYNKIIILSGTFAVYSIFTITIYSVNRQFLFENIISILSDGYFPLVSPLNSREPIPVRIPPLLLPDGYFSLVSPLNSREPIPVRIPTLLLPDGYFPLDSPLNLVSLSL